MKKAKKKKWVRPHLTVLLRDVGKQYNVLVGCKTYDPANNGVVGAFNSCLNSNYPPNVPAYNCSDCSAAPSS